MADEATVRAVVWRDVFAWLLLLRTFRLSISGAFLLLALLGAWLTPLGWWLSGRVFLPPATVRQDARFAGWVGEQQRLPINAGLLPARARDSWEQLPARFPVAWNQGPERIYRTYMAPFVELFGYELTLVRSAYLACGILWTLLVWSLLGGIMTRIATVRLGCEQRVGLRAATRYVIRKLPAYFGAPLFPLLGVAVLVMLTLPAGWLMRWDPGTILVGAVWCLLLLAGFLIAILLLGLGLGWPMMWPTISSEELGDVFEATQRSYSYTLERPLNYLFYGFVSLCLGLAGWLLVTLFCDSLVALTYWSVSWGAGAERMSLVEMNAVSYSLDGSLQGSGSLAMGNRMIAVWVMLVHSLPVAYTFSFFWCSATAIYLLMRQDVDQTEFDEIFLDLEDDQGMPPLHVDSAGVAGVPPPKVAPEEPQDSPSPEAAPPETPDKEE